jgi:hypothetical protein
MIFEGSIAPVGGTPTRIGSNGGVTSEDVIFAGKEGNGYSECPEEGRRVAEVGGTGATGVGAAGMADSSGEGASGSVCSTGMGG